ncbi:glycosyltransferase family 2 protein [Cellulomonas soli]|uniref:glycosyltransferase family 2 protein n=1 Tax=Cellulomonas soli TaxID=931535 RepID=UPI003F84FBED
MTMTVTTHRRPRVSVGIPLHNYEQYLEECVASVLAQDGVDVDITIIDDASTDGSLALARRWAAADPRVAVRVHETNHGHIATFTEALAVGDAPYVLKMDADDVLPPGALRRSLALMEAHPEVAFCYGYAQRFQGATPVGTRTAVRRWSVWSGPEWIERRVRRGHNVILQPEVVIRRSALAQVGGHDVRVAAASDLHLWLRLASVGSVARIDGPVQGLYRVHGSNMHSTMHGGFWRDLQARADAFALFLDEQGDRLPDLERTRATLARTLARDALRLVQRDAEGRIELEVPAQQFLDFARATDPTIERSAAWRRTCRADGTVRTGPVGALLRDLEDKARWRVWRRYGL